MNQLEIEERLLTKIAETENVLTCIEAGVSEDWFVTYQCRQAYQLQLEHQSNYAKGGTFDLYLANALAITKRPAPEESVETLCESLRISTLSTKVGGAAQKVIEEISLGSLPVGESLTKLLEALNAEIVSDLANKSGDGKTLVEMWPSFIEQEEIFRETHGLTGVPWPWPALNHATGGIHPGDYTVLMGYRKSRKTHVAVEIAVHTAQECGEPVLIISNELSLDDMRNRICCRWAKIPYRAFRHGQLTEAQREHLKTTQAELHYHPRLVVEHVPLTGTSAIAKVRALIEKYKPSLIFWDGHYLSAQSDDWKDVYFMSRRTRALALEMNVPFLVTVQLNPKKVEASYKAYHQDCTLSIKIEKDGEWAHCTTPEMREEEGVEWSMRCEAGLPFKEESYKKATEEEMSAVSPELILGEG